MMDFGHLARGYRAKSKNLVDETGRVGVGLNYDPILVIRLPDSRVLRILSRSLCLAMFILTLPYIGSVVRNSSSVHGHGVRSSDSSSARFDSLHLVLKDLFDEGLVKDGHKGLVLNSEFDVSLDVFEFLNSKGIDLVVESDLDEESLIPSGEFNFVFALGLERRRFIDRVLKVDGIAVVPMVRDETYEFKQQSNYKIVYVRLFDSTVVGLRKMSLLEESDNLRRSRKLLWNSNKEGRTSLVADLEDVLFEPPSKTLAKLSYKKINFLPNLLADSLQGYKRRIFVTDETEGVLSWFHKEYPARGQKFEVYEADDMSDWVKNNVKEDDFVVMKAEAGMVEKMIEEKTIDLVDELFLECKNQWNDGGKNKSKRPYWQCVDLFGRVRDEGVAVHQWWG